LAQIGVMVGLGVGRGSGHSLIFITRC
jgi:hypothetical protein